MKLKIFIAGLHKLVENNPKALDLEVVYSQDDEGNGYGKVHYEPSVGNHDGEYHGDFMNIEECADDEEINAVCIN